MAMKFANNATSKLVEAITADATTLKIKSEDVAKFPVLDSSENDFMHVTLVGDNAEHEIVKVTAVADDGTFTIVRAQENTTAKDWPIENRVELRITAFYLNSAATQDVVDMVESAVTELETKIDNLTTTVEADKVIADNVTITRNAEKKIIAKDIAINGDSSDLASARGFIYDNVVPFYPSIGNAFATDMDNLLNPGKYHIVISKDTLNIPPIKNFTSTGTTDGIIDIDVISSATSVSSFARRKQVLTVYGIGTTAKIWSRCQVTNVSDTNSWQPWEQEIRSGDIGEGIDNTNGVLSVPTYVGATETANATSGLVPAATSAERSMYLAGDGTWKALSGGSMDGYLPLTGGTLSGNLQFKSKPSAGGGAGVSSFPDVSFNNSKNGDTAVFISVNQSNSTPRQISQYKIQVHSPRTDAEYTTATLTMESRRRLNEELGEYEAENVLSFDGHDLVRSVNGVFADESGNVTVAGVGGDFLPLSGGTLSGNLSFKNNSMYPPAIKFISPAAGQAPFVHLASLMDDLQHSEFRVNVSAFESSSPATLRIISEVIDQVPSDPRLVERPTDQVDPDGEVVYPDPDEIIRPEIDPEEPDEQTTVFVNRLIFDGKDVVRSVGGVQAGDDGDIPASSLPFFSESFTDEKNPPAASYKLPNYGTWNIFVWGLTEGVNDWKAGHIPGGVNLNMYWYDPFSVKAILGIRVE